MQETIIEICDVDGCENTVPDKIEYVDREVFGKRGETYSYHLCREHWKLLRKHVDKLGWKFKR